MSSGEREEVLERLLEIAREASAIVAGVYGSEFTVDYKAPKDPVTAADRQSNEHICRRLAELYPDVPIVAEESDPETFSGFRASSRVFFVDPLDGTREFVKRNGEFAVMIGLLEDERPIVGVIDAPVRDMAWGGCVGSGAWRFDRDGSRHPIRVSATAELADARIVASRSHRSEVLEQALKLLGAARIDALGSAGLKCGEVATGGAEAYVAPGRAGHRWDVCAGEALVVAAGGRLTDAAGDPIDYRSRELANQTGIVATNGRTHDAILERLARIRDGG